MQTSIVTESPSIAKVSPWRLSVAPMMDWTDRHCRYLHRLITQKTRLYTEMVTTGALIHGDKPKHLDYDESEHPLALQLGGSEARDLAQCAHWAQGWGYDEVNLNCGCPSPRVQRGSFGACLMQESNLVADCLKAMQDTVSIPVTVKHRIGIDRHISYDFVRDFVGEVARRSGCQVFIVHARNAWLDGLSPKENREVPPLRYDAVYRLKRDFPGLTIVINGGITHNADIIGHLQHVDGVMVGRAAYHQPWMMRVWDAIQERLSSQGIPCDDAGMQHFLEWLQAHSDLVFNELPAVESAWMYYLQSLHEKQLAWPTAMRHALGLRHGRPGARLWRQYWSRPGLKNTAPAQVLKDWAGLQSGTASSHF
jgi:tRNA-dihydrouridine synthase A